MDNQHFEELLLRELTGEITASERRQLEEILAADPARPRRLERHLRAPVQRRVHDRRAHSDRLVERRLGVEDD